MGKLKLGLVYIGERRAASRRVGKKNLNSYNLNRSVYIDYYRGAVAARRVSNQICLNFAARRSWNIYFNDDILFINIIWFHVKIVLMIKILVLILDERQNNHNLFILLFKELYQVSKIIDKYVQKISVVELYAVWVNHCSCSSYCS